MPPKKEKPKRELPAGAISYRYTPKPYFPLPQSRSPSSDGGPKAKAAAISPSVKENETMDRRREIVLFMQETFKGKVEPKLVENILEDAGWQEGVATDILIKLSSDAAVSAGFRQEMLELNDWMEHEEEDARVSENWTVQPTAPFLPHSPSPSLRSLVAIGSSNSDSSTVERTLSQAACCLEQPSLLPTSLPPLLLDLRQLSQPQPSSSTADSEEFYNDLDRWRGRSSNTTPRAVGGALFKNIGSAESFESLEQNTHSLLNSASPRKTESQTVPTHLSCPPKTEQIGQRRQPSLDIHYISLNEGCIVLEKGTFLMERDGANCQPAVARASGALAGASGGADAPATRSSSSSSSHLVACGASASGSVTSDCSDTTTSASTSCSSLSSSNVTMCSGASSSSSSSSSSMAAVCHGETCHALVQSSSTDDAGSSTSGAYCEMAERIEVQLDSDLQPALSRVPRAGLPAVSPTTPVPQRALPTSLTGSLLSSSLSSHSHQGIDSRAASGAYTAQPSAVHQRSWSSVASTAARSFGSRFDPATGGTESSSQSVRQKASYSMCPESAAGLSKCQKEFVASVLHAASRGKKILVLMRGCPGSGKSSLARQLKGQRGIVLSTDDYFMQGDRYAYDSSRIVEAHEWNRKRAAQAMMNGVTPVVIDNTNTQVWEMGPYAELALDSGYWIELCEPMTSWRFNASELHRRNTHGVPLEQIKLMIDRYDRDLKPRDVILFVQRKRSVITTDVMTNNSNSVSREQQLTLPDNNTASPVGGGMTVLDEVRTRSSSIGRHKMKSQTIRRNCLTPEIEKLRNKDVSPMLAMPNGADDRTAESGGVAAAALSEQDVVGKASSSASLADGESVVSLLSSNGSSDGSGDDESALALDSTSGSCAASSSAAELSQHVLEYSGSGMDKGGNIASVPADPLALCCTGSPSRNDADCDRSAYGRNDAASAQCDPAAGEGSAQVQPLVSLNNVRTPAISEGEGEGDQTPPLKPATRSSGNQVHVASCVVRLSSTFQSLDISVGPGHGQPAVTDASLCRTTAALPSDQFAVSSESRSSFVAQSAVLFAASGTSRMADSSSSSSSSVDDRLCPPGLNPAPGLLPAPAPTRLAESNKECAVAMTAPPCAYDDDCDASQVHTCADVLRANRPRLAAQLGNSGAEGGVPAAQVLAPLPSSCDDPVDVLGIAEGASRYLCAGTAVEPEDFALVGKMVRATIAGVHLKTDPAKEGWRVVEGSGVWKPGKASQPPLADQLGGSRAQADLNLRVPRYEKSAATEEDEENANVDALLAECLPQVAPEDRQGILRECGGDVSRAADFYFDNCCDKADLPTQPSFPCAQEAAAINFSIRSLREEHSPAKDSCSVLNTLRPRKRKFSRKPVLHFWSSLLPTSRLRSSGGAARKQDAAKSCGISADAVGSDGFVTLPLTADCVRQLASLFGPVSIQDPRDEGSTSTGTLDVRVPLLLAQQLYQSVEETSRASQAAAARSSGSMQPGAYPAGWELAQPFVPRCAGPPTTGHSVVSAQELSDAELARRLHEEEMQSSLQLREIMDVELAKQLSYEEHKRAFCSQPTEPTMAERLWQKQLRDEFPREDEDLLYNAFEACGRDLPKTLEALGKGVAACEVPRGSPAQAVHSVTTDEPDDDDDDEWEDVADDGVAYHGIVSGENADALYQQSRQQANLHLSLKKECRQKAALARSKGPTAAAMVSWYAEQARIHGAEARRLHRQAALRIFSIRNKAHSEGRGEAVHVGSPSAPCVSSGNSIDLHGLHAQEAVEQVRRIVKGIRDEYQRQPDRHKRCLSIITGKGVNSRGGIPRVKRAVMEYLRQKSIRFMELNEGVLKVFL